MKNYFLMMLVLVVSCGGDPVGDISSAGGGDSVGDVSSASGGDEVHDVSSAGGGDEVHDVSSAGGGDSVGDVSSAGGGDSVGDVSSASEKVVIDEGTGGEVPVAQSLFGSAAFVEIPAGSFIMRGGESQVKVEISRSFEIMSTEVTQKQWFKVMEENPSYHKRSADCSNYDKVNKICPDHPVERVSWDDIQEFIKSLNDLQGLEGCDGTPGSARGCYRLPTEAEWEYAVRAGTDTTYFFGEDASAVLGDYAWYKDNSELKTHRVGQKKPNPWGLYDVYGNVMEWVQDVHRDELPGGIDPLVSEKSWLYSWLNVVRYVKRGGGFYSYKIILRSANRTNSPQTDSYKTIGFRLVRTL